MMIFAFIAEEGTEVEHIAAEDWTDAVETLERYDVYPKLMMVVSEECWVGERRDV